MPENQAIAPLFIALILGLCAGSAHADRQSLTSITLQAESFLAEYPYESPYPARFELSKLDKRLKLKPCNQDLNIKFSRPQKVMGNTSLTVRCGSPVSWQIHLPVRVDIYDDIALTRLPLVKGQSIDTHSIHFRKKNVALLHQGYFRQSDSFKRLQVKRNLPTNTILSTINVAPRLLVTSGQQVNILLNVNGLQIKSTGQALQSASHGQLIKVRNTQSNKVIEATVTSEGEVTVRL